MNVLRIAFVSVLAAAFGFAFHIYYGDMWVSSVLNELARRGLMNGVMTNPNAYPTWLVVVAALTAIIPATCKVVVYYFFGSYLPFQSRIAKGIAYGVILLAVGDNLLRSPIMSLAIGNPGVVVLLQSAEAWVIYIGTGVLIALIVPVKSYASLAKK